ncbi:DUF3703 domain-containing protein [Ramlibacter sp. AN1133]|uniref:DUF3703 domain-containing protein n=1 Tax=Ramlibacter sp. AN1133 TaxID=3133429 RepID=UPI0030C3B7E3
MDHLSPDERRIVYARLVRGYADTAAVGQPAEAQWEWLMAAHVVGQHDAGLHFDSHCRMLELARRSRDWREAAGQVLRIALLPLGHLLGRIPVGNIGRATVRVTQPMQPPEAVQVLIDVATLATKLPEAR